MPPRNRCNACFAEFATRGQLTRHTSRKNSCREALKEYYRRQFARIGTRPENYHAGPHLPNLRFDDYNNSFPGEEGDDVSDQLFREVQLPAPVREPPVRRTTLAEEPEEDTEIVDVYLGGGAFQQKRVERPLEADFARLGHAFGPFAQESDWDLARWATLENVSDNAVSRLLEIEALHAGLSLRSARDINKKIDLLPSPAKFQHVALSVNEVTDSFDLYWRDPLEVIGDLLADPSFADVVTFTPERRYTTASRRSRLFNEMHTGEWWWRMQVGALTCGARKDSLFHVVDTPPRRCHCCTSHS